MHHLMRPEIVQRAKPALLPVLLELKSIHDGETSKLVSTPRKTHICLRP